MLAKAITGNVLFGGHVRRLLAAALLCASLGAHAQQTAEDTRQMIAEGVKAHDRRDFDGAIRIYRQVLEKDPDNALALHELAFTLFAKRDCPLAIETALRGLQVENSPRPRSQFFVMIGNCRDILGDPKASIQAYRSALELNGRDYMTLYNLGVTLAGTGDVQQAQASFERAVTIEPSHPSSHYALSRMLHAQGRTGASMLAMLRFLSLEPSSPRAANDFQRMDMLFASGVVRDPATGKTTIKVNPATLERSPLQATLELALALSETNATMAAADGAAAPLDPAQSKINRLVTFVKIVGETAAKDAGTDFESTHYLPFFKEIHARGQQVGFATFVLQARYPTQVRAWLTANPSEAQAFQQWLRDQRRPVVLPPQN